MIRNKISNRYEKSMSNIISVFEPSLGGSVLTLDFRRNFSMVSNITGNFV